MNTRSKSLRCGDKTVRAARYQPIVVVERIPGRKRGKRVRREKYQELDEDVQIKREIVEETSNSLDASRFKGEEDPSISMNLYLSPDSEGISDVSDFIKTEIKDEPCSETFLPDNESFNHSGQPDIYGHSSQAVFENSPNQMYSQDMYQANLSADRLSVDQNREKTEEWDSQEITNVSMRLRRRREQVKRMFSEVIRKRQVTDETLEAVKKRLKKL